MSDYYIRLISLPLTVEGITVTNDDGTYSVYINADISPIRQHGAIIHELRHVRGEHIYQDMPLKRAESLADGKPFNVFADVPKGRIAEFKSLESFKRYVEAIT